MKTINDRIRIIIDTMFDGNVSEFARSTQTKQPTINTIIGTRKSKPSFDVVNAIALSVEGLNIDWLITGDGNMYKEKQTEKLSPVYLRNSGIQEKIIERQDIPLYNIHAAAGLKLLFEGNRQNNMIDTLRIPNLTKCDGAIYITGDSMYPLLKSGDIVIFKEIRNIEYMHFGDIYLLSYNLGDDEYFVIKYVQKSEKEGHLRLVSYNQYHQSIDIPINAVTAIALVKASVRYNSMQ